MDPLGRRTGHGFGTAPVFLAGISTILGAILFLRFGYAVGHAGLLGSFLIIIIGHMITVPTALAVAEIATNRKVEGGGEYYIISRSFGTTIGAAIGISLYFSQAISVAFYMIAFGEVFRPLFPWVESFLSGRMGLALTLDTRIISLPATLILAAFILKKGASLGIKALWVVAVILGLSLALFLAGSPLAPEPGRAGTIASARSGTGLDADGGRDPGGEEVAGSVRKSADQILKGDLFHRTESPDSWIIVFAICFPAFTGMTAGVGLSGDLKNPRRSLPLGTLAATLVGMTVYALVVLKLHVSASPNQLADTDSLVMSRIALWGPIIPIGLCAASLSSAVGSILVAPRTLQALGHDSIFPFGNALVSRGKGATNEPVNATLLTAALAISFVALGGVNIVAQIISMFFMVTYGSLCGISFLEHFAKNPSYRPSFRSKWYFSLAGALLCFMMMFQMSPLYAILALLLMTLIYLGVRSSRKDARGLAAIFQGVMFQSTRWLQILLQKNRATFQSFDWRPSFVAISRHTLDRLAPFELLKWISHRYGFGTFIHYVEGYLSVGQVGESRKILDQLISKTEASGAGIFVDTTVAPSFGAAVSQVIQMPGVSGLENNSVLFEYDDDHPNELPELVKGCSLAGSLGYNTCVLRSSERHFGYKRTLHVWLTRYDDTNANLMILLAYIILGHPDWRRAEITIYVTFPSHKLDEQVIELNSRIASGRLPISARNVRAIPADDGVSLSDLVTEHSADADLVILGYNLEVLEKRGQEAFLRYKSANDLLFVNANQKIVIT
jgi:amino acid transporter